MQKKIIDGIIGGAVLGGIVGIIMSLIPVLSDSTLSLTIFGITPELNQYELTFMMALLMAIPIAAAGALSGFFEALPDERKEEKLRIAKELLDILDDEAISQKTGLPLDEIRELRQSTSGK